MGYEEYRTQGKKLGFLAHAGIHSYFCLWHHVVLPDYALSSPYESVIIYMSKAKVEIIGRKLQELFSSICEQELSFVNADDKPGENGVFISAVHVELNED